MEIKKTRIRIPQVSKIKAELQKEINSKCPFCNNTDVGHFEIHHIDDNPSNNKQQNLILLCPLCHSKITKGDISQNEVLITKNNLMITKNNIIDENIKHISIDEKLKMAKIPVIYGKSYPEAKELLIASGWIPNLHHWSIKETNNMLSGTGAILWEMGYYELFNCSGTGYNFCKFIYRDIYDNELSVITAGEIIDNDINSIVVCNVKVNE